MPTLKQIRYFLNVADLGGFTQAASLFVAQSALSRQIGEMENELGFALFEREPRGVRLTLAVAAYRDRIASIPAVLANAAEEGQQLARGEAGVLRLLHSSTVPLASLMDSLSRFAEQCAYARVELDRASSEEQVTLVADGRADLGVVRLPILRRDSRVHFVELSPERLWVALPAGHALAKRKRIEVIELQAELFASAVYRDRGGLSRVVTDLCLKRGFVPNAARIVSPKASMLDLVAARYGLAVVPERMTASCLSRWQMRMRNPLAQRFYRTRQRCWRRDSSRFSIRREMPQLGNSPEVQKIHVVILNKTDACCLPFLRKNTRRPFHADERQRLQCL